VSSDRRLRALSVGGDLPHGEPRHRSPRALDLLPPEEIGDVFADLVEVDLDAEFERRANAQRRADVEVRFERTVLDTDVGFEFNADARLDFDTGVYRGRAQSQNGRQLRAIDLVARCELDQAPAQGKRRFELAPLEVCVDPGKGRSSACADGFWDGRYLTKSLLELAEVVEGVTANASEPCRSFE
jgi:hypothetical protein